MSDPTLASPAQDTSVQLKFSFREGRGVPWEMLAQLSRANWAIQRVVDDPADEAAKSAACVSIEVSGSSKPDELLQLVTAERGVKSVRFITQEDLG
jgi:hypothetical protein